MDLGGDGYSSTNNANNAPADTRLDSNEIASHAPSNQIQMPLQGQIPVLDQLDPRSIPPDLLSALQQLDPERQQRAIEMLVAEQQLQTGPIEEQATQQQQQTPDEHFLTIALNGK